MPIKGSYVLSETTRLSLAAAQIFLAGGDGDLLYHNSQFDRVNRGILLFPLPKISYKVYGAIFTLIGLRLQTLASILLPIHYLS